MIELAGGRYIFDDPWGTRRKPHQPVSLQMEEFYAGAKDADYIIYNSTIEGELSSSAGSAGKEPAALRSSRRCRKGMYTARSKNLYQSTMALGTITSDIRRMLTGDDADLTYICTSWSDTMKEE